MRIVDCNAPRKFQITLLLYFLIGQIRIKQHSRRAFAQSLIPSLSCETWHFNIYTTGVERFIKRSQNQPSQTNNTKMSSFHTTSLKVQHIHGCRSLRSFEDPKQITQKYKHHIPWRYKKHNIIHTYQTNPTQQNKYQCSFEARKEKSKSTQPKVFMLQILWPRGLLGQILWAILLGQILWGSFWARSCECVFVSVHVWMGVGCLHVPPYCWCFCL